MTEFLQALLSALLTASLLEYMRDLAAAVIRLSAYLLPPEQRQRYAREWLADLNTQEGQVRKLGWALSTAWGAVQVGQALRQEEQRVLHLAREVDQVVRGLALAVAVTNPGEAGHTARVIALSDALSVHLGLTSQDRQALRWGACLHDIGKLAIDQHITRKPGKLTADEFTVLKGHCTTGYDTARQIHGLPQATLDIVLHHHECYNGTGYPTKLAGESIPRLARLFTIIDIFDALSTDRVYKKAWSVEATLDEMGSQAGRYLGVATRSVNPTPLSGITLLTRPMSMRSATNPAPVV